MRRYRAVLLTLVLWAGPAAADRGLIGFDPQVKLFEPNQRAIIAWNGEEELLVLSTDVRASKATRVLEILPCPAEPKVAKGSLDTFKTATRIINRYLERAEQDRGASKGAIDEEDAAGQITFHKKIGAHDVSVVKVLSAEKFVAWVEGALKKAGVASPVIPEWARQAVGRYLAEGFEWFVFDSVELGAKLATAEPLRYRFTTPRLYYPLKITKVSGRSAVELIILTPKLLDKFPALPFKKVRVAHQPFSITRKELKQIDPEMSALLGDQPRMKLRIWKLTDGGKGFDADLLAH